MSRGRPALKLGQHGRISTKRVGKGAVAKCRVRDMDGVTRQVTASAGSTSAAVAALQDRLAERQPDGAGEVTRATKLDALAVLWLGEVERSDRSTNTKQRYAEVTRDHVVAKIGQVRIGEASVQLLQAHLDRVATDVGLATAKLTKSNLSGMLAIAVKYGAIDRNPVREVTLAADKRDEVTALSVDEVVAVRVDLAADPIAVRQDLVDPIKVVMATGCRLGEVLALRWSEVDLAADVPSVLITGTVIRKAGVGMVRQPHPKSATGKRRLPLPDWARDVLLDRKVDAPANDLDLVFPSAAGTLRDATNLRKQWRACRARHGWADITPKSFRKAVATHLATDDMAIASAQLGHSGTRVTQDHYVQRTHTAPDSRDLLQAFGGEPQTVE